MSYRRRASPLHAARAAAAIGWCVALAVAALIQSNPVLLGAIALSVVAAGVLAGVGRELRRSLIWAVPLWFTIAAINALVARDGLDRDLAVRRPARARSDEHHARSDRVGAVLGLQAVTLVLIGTLYSVAVDPDEVLRLFRGFSFSSALSATIATRMVPVLVRDSRRLAEAQRCRPGRPPGRAQLLRATTSGVLDRALDVAATLEVRGYGAVRRRTRGRAASAAARLVPPRPRVRSLRVAGAGGCRGGAGDRLGWRSRPIRCCARPLARALWSWRRCSCWRRWRRSPTGGGSCGEPRLDQRADLQLSRS